VNLEDLPQPHLAAAVVDRCGGRLQPIPWERVALAIWRAFPDRASLRTGLLPDTYSIQTWVWDAKTKLSFLSGGTREGGWRVTPDGVKWLDQNPDVRRAVADLLPDSQDYLGTEPQALILACLSRDPRPRSSIVIDAFRRFPEVFGLAPARVWPDSSIADRSLSQAESKGWVVQSGGGFSITDAGVERRSQDEDVIGARRDATASSKRSIASQYAIRVESTMAYRTYLESGDRDGGTVDELYVLMRCPPNAGQALAEASLAELIDNLARADRPDLVGFVVEWTARVAPDLRMSERVRRT
jgi:hypothetical protein